MIATALEYAALIAGCTAFALGYMLFWFEFLPAVIDAARWAARIIRAVFLAIGWAVVIARLLL